MGHVQVNEVRNFSFIKMAANCITNHCFQFLDSIALGKKRMIYRPSKKPAVLLFFNHENNFFHVFIGLIAKAFLIIPRTPSFESVYAGQEFASRLLSHTRDEVP
jgi:hypothetical protein